MSLSTSRVVASNSRVPSTNVTPPQNDPMGGKAAYGEATLGFAAVGTSLLESVTSIPKWATNVLSSTLAASSITLLIKRAYTGILERVNSATSSLPQVQLEGVHRPTRSTQQIKLQDA